MSTEKLPVIVLFRRDLRLEDHTALNAAAESGHPVLAVFLLHPRQATPEKNAYFSVNGFTYMLESLQELHVELLRRSSGLHVLHGGHKVLISFATQHNAAAVYTHTDYTPFAQARDAALQKSLAEQDIELNTFHDYTLTKPGSVLTKSETPYKVFTPFSRAARTQAVAEPQTLSPVWAAVDASTVGNIPAFPENRAPQPWVRGGRTAALECLKQACHIQQYDEKRNIPSVHGTSSLSAAHKFGTISIRESFHTLLAHYGPEHTILTELYWRDFFTHVGATFSRVFGHSFRPEFEAIQWSDNEAHWQAWCEGKTGFPIVDAGMRQLVATGWMHNRVRMITASFLVKDLHIDWRRGEQFFARHLVDYDPSVNNGNWQWAASTGCDAQPYFRIFNPWSQQERYDPDAEYIKQWVPELESLSAKEIHTWSGSLLSDYPAPIIDHKPAAQEAKAMFKAAKEAV